MAISSTSASVPGGAWSTASGKPISVLKFSGLADTCSREPSIAARMSLVEVLPVEPVIATTLAPCAPSSRRQAPASACRPRSGSGCSSTTPPLRADSAACACWGASSAPHAPARSACAPCAPPSLRSPRSPTKSLPRVMRRESTLTPRGPGWPPGPPAASAARSPASRRAPAISATRAASQPLMFSAPDTARSGRTAGDRRSRVSPRSRRCARARRRPEQGLSDHRHVVEGRLSPFGELLSLLVALARYHHDVARAGTGDGLGDRRSAVADGLHLRLAGRAASRVRPGLRPVAGRDPGDDLRDDLLRVLRAGVVGGDEHDVGFARGDRAPQRALAAIAG